MTTHEQQQLLDQTEIIIKELSENISKSNVLLIRLAIQFDQLEASLNSKL
jgi:hypothetical protein